jgi:hypothetical protein
MGRVGRENLAAKGFASLKATGSVMLPSLDKDSSRKGHPTILPLRRLCRKRLSGVSMTLLKRVATEQTLVSKALECGLLILLAVILVSGMAFFIPLNPLNL